MCSARRLIALYICMKFRENITIGIRVMEQTRGYGRNGYVQCLKGNSSVSRQNIITVHVFFTLSYSASHWCKVCENISNGIRIMERKRNYESLTDGQKFKISDDITYYLVTFCGGA